MLLKYITILLLIAATVAGESDHNTAYTIYKKILQIRDTTLKLNDFKAITKLKWPKIEISYQQGKNTRKVFAQYEELKGLIEQYNATYLKKIILPELHVEIINRRESQAYESDITRVIAELNGFDQNRLKELFFYLERFDLRKLEYIQQQLTQYNRRVNTILNFTGQKVRKKAKNLGITLKGEIPVRNNLRHQVLPDLQRELEQLTTEIKQLKEQQLQREKSYLELKLLLKKVSKSDQKKVVHGEAEEKSSEENQLKEAFRKKEYAKLLKKLEVAQKIDETIRKQLKQNQELLKQLTEEGQFLTIREKQRQLLKMLEQFKGQFEEINLATGAINKLQRSLQGIKYELLRLQESLPVILNALGILKHLSDKDPEAVVAGLEAFKSSKIPAMFRSEFPRHRARDSYRGNLIITATPPAPGKDHIQGVVIESIIRGLARRTRRELYRLFFKQLTRELRVDLTTSTLFRETLRYLEQYQRHLKGAPGQMQEQFVHIIKKDLEQLPVTLFRTIKLERYSNYINTLFQIIRGLKKGEHPFQVLNNLTPTGDQEVDQVIALLKILSRELLDYENNRWITVREFNRLPFRDQIGLAALIYYRNMKRMKTLRLPVDEMVMFRIIKELIPVMGRIEGTLRDARRSGSSAVMRAGYYRVIADLFGMINRLIAQFDTIEEIISDGEVKTVIDLIRGAEQNNYSDLFFQIDRMLNQLRKRYKKRREILARINHLQQIIYRYGTLFQQLISIKNKDQLDQLLEGYVDRALDHFALSLYTTGTVRFHLKGDSGVPFFHAPLGFDYSIPLWGHHLRGTFGVYAYDLGEMVRDQSFILTPGINLMLHFSGLSIKGISPVLGGGYEYVYDREHPHIFHAFIGFRVGLIEIVQ